MKAHSTPFSPTEWLLADNPDPELSYTAHRGFPQNKCGSCKLIRESQAFLEFQSSRFHVPPHPPLRSDLRPYRALQSLGQSEGRHEMRPISPAPSSKLSWATFLDAEGQQIYKIPDAEDQQIYKIPGAKGQQIYRNKLNPFIDRETTLITSSPPVLEYSISNPLAIPASQTYAPQIYQRPRNSIKKNSTRPSGPKFTLK